MQLYSKKDVLVVGGGTSGFIAAIAAARNGASCLIVEQYGFLGGTMTASLLPHCQTFYDSKGNQIIKGIPQELIERLEKEKGALGHLPRPPIYWGTDTPYDGEVYKKITDDMVKEEGVDVLFHTFACEPIIYGQELKGIIIQNKSGRQIILADITIDCTGDGDIAAFAGAPYKKGRDSDGLCQGVSFQFEMLNVDLDKTATYIQSTKNKDKNILWALSDSGVIGKKLDSKKESFVRLVGTIPKDIIQKDKLPADFEVFTMESIREGRVIMGHPHVLNVDATNAKSLTEANFKGRRKVHKFVSVLKKYIPGFENAYLNRIAPHIGVRETRRIIGDYVLTSDDIKSSKVFFDSVAKGAFPIDVHSTEKLGDEDNIFEYLESAYTIPFRCLIPKKLKNILVAGRCISTDREANGSIRVTPTCMALGQAAGTAASLCVLKQVSPRELEIKELQNLLKSQGVVL